MRILFHGWNFRRGISVTLLCLYVAATSSLAGPADRDGLSSDRQAAPSVQIPQDNVLKDDVSQSGEIAGAKKKASDELPQVPLTNELLYQILSADIAEQRGLDIYAYETMLDVAKETKDPRLARRAAEIAVSQRKAEEALRAVRLWHRLAPESEEAEKYLFGFLVLDNRLDEVKEIFATKLADTTSNEERVSLFFQLQQVLAGTKDKSDAFAVMEDVLSPYLNMPEAHVSLAVSALLKKDSVRAQEEAKKALVLKPDSEMAVLTYAQAVSNTTEASAILYGFLEKYPESREVRISLARLLVGQKQYDRARHEFEILLKSDSNDLTALYSLGLLAIQQNDYTAADTYFQSYLENAGKEQKTAEQKQHETTQVLFLLSQIAEERHQYDKALQWLSQITLDDDDEVTLGVEIRRAQIYAKKGDIKRARAIIAELEKQNPYERERLLLTEAQILKEVGKPQEALTVLKAGLDEFPDNTSILYDYALTAENLGQYELMEDLLRRIITLDSRHQQAYNALGYSLADRNIRLDEAYTLIDKALKLAPDDPYITDSMGWVLFRQGKLEKAEQYLRRAYAVRADNEIAVHLAEVLWVKGERQEAKSLLWQVRKNDPESKLLQETLSRLGVRF